MKKIIFLIIGFLITFNISNANFGDINSMDLYKNINSGMHKLNTTLIKKELKGGTDDNSNILKEVNKISNDECLDDSKDISDSKFYKIIDSGDVKGLSKLIKDECKDEDGNISEKVLKNSLSNFKKHKNNSTKTAKNKSNKIYKLSNIGIYADGSKENSGFDLIYDIEEIDKIIFASFNEYEGEENKNISDLLDELVNPNTNDNDDDNSEEDSDTSDDENDAEEDSDASDDNEYIVPNGDDEEIYSNYICPTNNNSGLSSDDIAVISSTIDPSVDGGIIGNWGNYNDYGLVNWDGGYFDRDLDNVSNPDNNINSPYEEFNDNSIWPCNKFFCIKINFRMYDHKLLGGSENITIEYILTRSNDHLKKFTSTSLIQSKMTDDNFQIGLKDFGLPDMFHLSFQVSYMPVPILKFKNKNKDINKNEKEKKVSVELQEKYYKAHGLNYERRNDLSMIKHVEQDKQSILNSGELKTSASLEKFRKYKEYQRKTSKKVDFINKSVEKEVSNEIMTDFEKQFIELSNFTNAIRNYVNDIESVVKGMKEIPTGT